MPVTLEQSKLTTQDDIVKGVIDEFRKSSFILDNITFDDAVTPGTQGATLTYGYTRLITQPTADFRAVNTEYTPQEVTKQRYTTDLKIFGGAFEIDRVLANVGGLASEIDLQLAQKIKAARALFHDTVINGDTGADADSFDGLNKAITGSATEYTPTQAAKYIDLSTSALLDTNYKDFLDQLDDFLSLLGQKPGCLASNSKMINRIKAIARRAGYFSQTEDAFGRKVDNYDGIPLVDLGDKPGANSPVVPIVSRDADGGGAGGSITGITDLFAWSFGLDAFHGVSMKGQPLVKTYLPDMTLPGAVKKGEVEMVAAVALKATKAAGVFRNIKVQ